MASILGWKDILRPIRDGYRHLFPTPDTGPTPEERRKQRELDKLKGFAYFDTFEQLASWSELESDPLQRANIPLLPRAGATRNVLGKAAVLLCHDYAGNYHDYEGVSAIGLSEEMYACEYLQYVDTFIYFSHKLVCVPPPTWINTLHRNGVKALGTILIEPQTLGSEELLQRGDDGLSFPLAKKLADIAEHHDFDGWLVNIEKPFPKEAWDPYILQAFLRQLRHELGEKNQLIWYDALTTSNRVSYQNALSSTNVPFAKACGNILTNYCWKEANAEGSVHLGLREDIPPQQIFFGIDVWAQNVTKLAHPRTTYPEYGGGGTNTGVAVAKLAEMGLSAGVFAPAWSFEHFPGHGRVIERAMWEGTDLPESIECSCGNCTVRHRSNKDLPITKFAKSFVAGSEAYFFTDFRRAFGTHGLREKETIFKEFDVHSQLGSQSPLPLAPCSDNSSLLSHRLEEVAGQPCLAIDARCSPESSSISTQHLLPLFNFDMPADNTLQLHISYTSTALAQQVRPSIYLHINNTTHFFPTDTGPSPQTLTIPISTSAPATQRLHELGMHLSSPYPLPDFTTILRVHSILIAPLPISPSLPLSSISNLTLTSHKSPRPHTRLHWEINSVSIPGLPCSAVTGAFEAFQVRIDGVRIGRVGACECIVPEALVREMGERGEERGENGVEIEVKGWGFDGSVLAVERGTISLYMVSYNTDSGV